MPTGLRSFNVARKGDYSTYPPFKDSNVALWAKMSAEYGYDYAESLIAAAEPAGKTLKKVYEAFRDEILADLQAALPVDAVLLDLHGAMVADGYDDCEGDLISHIRQIVGQDVPIGVELDLHCHISSLMVDSATIIITYKEYPHTEMADRAVELFNLIVQTVEGKIKPTMALYDTGMIALYYPTVDPMRAYVDKMSALEGKDGVLSVSLGHGFPWGDVPDLGTKTLVVTDNDAQDAEELAQSLGQELWAMRDTAVPFFYDIDGALDYALAAQGQPIVIADVSDNAGGGAPSDSTFLLQRMLERRITSVAIGCIWDPIAAGVAIEAARARTLTCASAARWASHPAIRLTCTSRSAGSRSTPNSISARRRGAGSAARQLGRRQRHGIDIVLISTRTQTFDPIVFTNVGIDPKARKS